MRMEKSADAFRTISEVAEDLDLPQHVLRFWETRFVQIKPLKRAGGRQFYRPDDVELLRAIQRLLYGEGYTIKGVQKLLKDQGVSALVASNRGERAGPRNGANAVEGAGLPRRPGNGAGHLHGGDLHGGDTRGGDLRGGDLRELQEAQGSYLADQASFRPNAMIVGEATYPDVCCENAVAASLQMHQPLQAETLASMEKLLAELIECQRILDVGRRR